MFLQNFASNLAAILSHNLESYYFCEDSFFSKIKNKTDEAPLWLNKPLQEKLQNIDSKFLISYNYQPRQVAYQTEWKKIKELTIKLT